MARTAKKTETQAAAQQGLTDGVEKMTKGIETAAAFGQENVEAVVESSKIAAKAAESMSAEIAAYSKRAYEESLAAAKDLCTCKTPVEFFEKHTAFTKVSVETFVGEAAKLHDMYAAATKEVIAPLSARVTAAAAAVKEFHA